MEKTNGNEGAFPRTNSTGCDDHQDGLTKREYFAALAMNGMIASSYGDSYNSDILSGDAVRLADALISSLNNQ